MKKFGIGIDLGGFEIKNVLVDKLGSEPTGVAGRIYYNTGDNIMYYYNGTTWQSLDASIVAGNGLTLTGNTLDVVAANDSMTINANSIQTKLDSQGGITINTGQGLRIAVDNSTLELNTNALRVKADGITKDHLASNVAGVGLDQNVDGSLEVTYGFTAGTAIEGDEATATPTADKVVIADNGGKVDGWVSSASTTIQGKVELATQAETEAKSDNVRAVTPAALVNFALKKNFDITGDGSTAQFDLTHNLGTRDVMVQVYLNGSPYDTVEVEVQRTDNNTVRIIFGAAPSNGVNHRAVII